MQRVAGYHGVVLQFCTELLRHRPYQHHCIYRGYCGTAKCGIMMKRWDSVCYYLVHYDGKITIPIPAYWRVRYEQAVRLPRDGMQIPYLRDFDYLVLFIRKFKNCRLHRCAYSFFIANRLIGEKTPNRVAC